MLEPWKSIQEQVVQTGDPFSLEGNYPNPKNIVDSKNLQEGILRQMLKVLGRYLQNIFPIWPWWLGW